jgi:hypothetical protein
MAIEALGANDAGGTSRPHRHYQIPFALLPIAWLLRAQREGERKRSSDPTRAQQCGVGGG